MSDQKQECICAPTLVEQLGHRDACPFRGTNDPGRGTGHTPSYAEEQLDYIEERDSKKGRSTEQAEQPAGASGEKWHSTVQVNQTWPCSCTDGNHHGGHYVHADYLNALEAKADRLDMETCNHEVVSRLKDAGEYGSEVLTDWEWCAGCGAVKLAHNQTWTKPANGTPNLPAKLNDLTDRLRAAEAALDATMIRHDEETQRLYTDMRAAETDAERLAKSADAFLGPRDEMFVVRLKAYDELEAALAAHNARKEAEDVTKAD